MKKLLIIAGVLGAALIGYRVLGARETSERDSAEKQVVSEAERVTAATHESARPTVKIDRNEVGGDARRPDDGVRVDPEKAREGLMKLLGQSGAKPKPPATPEGTTLDVAVQAREAAAEKGELSDAENRVMAMYERMGRAFTAHSSDCTKMGLTISEIVREDGRSLSELTASWEGLSPEQRASQQQRIEQAIGDGVETLRQSFRGGLAKCADNEDLKTALRALADASEPVAAAE